MTATLPDVAANKKEQAEQSAEQQVAAELGFLSMSRRCHSRVERWRTGGHEREPNHQRTRRFRIKTNHVEQVRADL